MDKRLVGCNVVDKDKMLGYTHRVIVNGSRNYNDYDFFKNFMKEHFIDDMEFKNNLCFITGMAFTGADDLIITFCKEYNIPIYSCPVQWYNENGDFIKAAGMIRNTLMLELGNQLVSFYDGQSKGTAHMLDIASKIKMKRFIIKITIEKD